MTVTTYAGELRRQVGIVSRAVGSRTTLPVLANVRLRAEGGCLDLAANDLELSLQTRVEAQVDAPGATTVPAKKLRQLLGLLPAGQVTIEAGARDRLTVRTERGETVLPGLPADEWPEVNVPEPTATLELPPGLLRRGLELCLPAVSRDLSRSRLCGVHLRSDGKTLRCCATDTHRMAVWQTPRELPEADVIVPTRTVRELLELLPVDTTEPVMLGLSDTHLEAEIEGVRLTSRLVDGEFPNPDRVIPSRSTWLVQVRTAALRGAAERCALVSEQALSRHKGVLILLPGIDEELRLLAESSDGAAARETLTGQDLEFVSVPNGETDLLFGLNLRFLLDMLRTMHAEHVVMGLTEAHQPMVTRPVEPPDDECLLEEEHCHLVMPMSLPDGMARDA